MFFFCVCVWTQIWTLDSRRLKNEEKKKGRRRDLFCLFLHRENQKQREKQQTEKKKQKTKENRGKSVLRKWRRQIPVRSWSCWQSTTTVQHLPCLFTSGYFVSCCFLVSYFASCSIHLVWVRNCNQGYCLSTYIPLVKARGCIHLYSQNSELVLNPKGFRGFSLLLGFPR